MALTQRRGRHAAVELLAEVGLEALTLRRLATELGVSAPTLYWHVHNKRALLDLMAEALVVSSGPQDEPAPGEPWWEWLEQVPAVFAPWSTPRRDLVLAGNRPSEGALPGVEKVLASLVAVGIPPAEALRALSIGDYVIGSAVEHQAEATRDPDPERDARFLQRAGELPNLRAAIAGLDGPGPQAGDAGFEYGLALLISGARAHHATLAGAGVAT